MIHSRIALSPSLFKSLHFPSHLRASSGHSFNYFIRVNHHQPRNNYIMAAINGNPPKITLYTNHRCPYAHRAHIAIKELGLPYEEVIIDLDTPRPQWYLDINPVCIAPFSRHNHADKISSAASSLRSNSPVEISMKKLSLNQQS
jgi:hypothetical protein